MLRTSSCSPHRAYRPGPPSTGRAGHADGRDRLPERLLEQAGRERLGWWGQAAGAAALGGGVQADDGVEVDRAAPLELGHLGVGDPDQPPQLPLLEADQPAEGTLDGDGGPPPQLGRERVPQHLRLGVVAGRAERLAQPRVVLVVAVPAAIPDAVRAAGTLPVGVAGQHQPPLRLAGVDPAEAGSGEGHEQPRMRRHRLGDALAALEAGGQELVGIGPVGGRTRRAAGLPAGAARLEQHPIRLPLAVVDGADLAGLPGRRARPGRPGGSGGGSSRPGRPARPTGHSRGRPAPRPRQDAGEQLAHPGRLAHAASPGAGIGGHDPQPRRLLGQQPGRVAPAGRRWRG